MRWVGYQRRWLEDRSRQKVYVKSRRIGISEVVAFEIACAAVGVDMLGPKVELLTPVPQAIISASWMQAKDLLAKVMRHVHALEMAFSSKLVLNESATGAMLTGNVPIRAFSSNPRSIRGFEGDVTWDECAATPRAHDVWAAAEPLAGSTLRSKDGYRIRVVFTPEGDGNFAYDIVHGERKDRWSVHRTTIHEALDEGFELRGSIEDLMASAGDRDMFAQEYECAFLSSSMRYISAELYDSAVYYECPQENRQGRWAGYDVARHRDLIAAVEMFGARDAWWVEEVRRERGMPWDDQEAWLSEIMGRVSRCAADSTGMGDQFAERAGKKYGARFEGVQFTAQNKAELATGLKLAFERKSLQGGPKLRVPDDPALRRAVLAIRRDVTQHGNVTYNAPRDPRHGHADEAWALALAIHAAGGAAKTVLRSKPRVRERPPQTRRMFDRSGKPV